MLSALKAFKHVQSYENDNEIKQVIAVMSPKVVRRMEKSPRSNPLSEVCKASSYTTKSWRFLKHILINLLSDLL